MNYALIRRLLDYAQAYELQNSYPLESNIQKDEFISFLGWLNQRVATENTPMIDSQTQIAVGRQSPDTLICELITFLYRYARSLTKRALVDTPLVSFDDFSYMVTIVGHPGLTKMEVIQRNIHEKTTGMEIIKRLKINDLVVQMDDEADKRSKRLYLTPKGFRLLETIWPAMAQMATLVGGPININEKLQLIHLLSQLHQFHNPIFLNDKNETMAELLTTLKK